METNLRRITVLAAGALVFGIIGQAVLHRGTAPTIASVAAAALPPEDSDAQVIRFVKNPEPAPAFEATDITGNSLSKADWNGKVVLINFWATWCPPCRMEIPEMIELQKEYKDRLVIVGISEDDDPAQTVLKFAQRRGINYSIVMYTPELVESYGGVPALPTTFLIDTQGRVVQKHSGLYPIESYHAEIRALLGLPTSERIETFDDTGQVFLKNAAKATELPGVDFKGLTPDQKKAALHRMNAEGCTCGCEMTISECRVNDSECPVSEKLAGQIVKDAASGKVPPRPPSSPGTRSTSRTPTAIGTTAFR